MVQTTNTPTLKGSFNMAGELVRRVNEPSSAVSRFMEPGVVKEARRAYNEVQLADFKASGSMALAAKIMQGAVELDNVRQQLSGGDPVTAAMLADFQDVAFQKAKNIQRGLFNDFGL